MERSGGLRTALRNLGLGVDPDLGSGVGAQVLTACLPDPARVFGLPAVLGRPLARRIEAVNAAVHRVSERCASVHLHPPELPGAYDPRMWSVDRLPPGERGHRLLAAGALRRGRHPRTADVAPAGHGADEPGADPGAIRRCGSPPAGPAGAQHRPVAAPRADGRGTVVGRRAGQSSSLIRAAAASARGSPVRS
jgi:hypothetical protein